MKVVALLSGGKDSCFNLLECVANGHEPIAVGGLLPTAGVDELDSFMFQTVGLSLLPQIARALRLPLFTRIIKGKPVTVASEYGSRRGVLDRDEAEGTTGGGGTFGDETEDLYELLKEVKAAHPDVEAVSVGAILSSYQRVRVEQVCGRLGLTPLAFMWQASQSTLMTKIIASGMSCVLVKVAGVGLEERDLGKTLNVLESKLRRLNGSYGLHICGEGGEYETVTLDSPLFYERINLVETEITTVDASPVAPVAHLRILKTSLERKIDFVPLTAESARMLLDEALEQDMDTEVFMDEDSIDIRSRVESALAEFQASPPSLAEILVADQQSHCLESSGPLQRVERNGWVCIGGVNGLTDTTQEPILLENEVHNLFRNLKAALHPHSLTSIQSISLFLSSMTHFPLINAVYKQYFGTSPPTRACVATLLPNGERARVEAIAYVGREGERPNEEGEVGGRRGLHVQSLSYWAPANIGPYSQAIIVDRRLAMAGQIPLIPPSLTLPAPQSFSTEVALSLKHVQSIWAALKEGTGGSALGESFVEGCICWIDPVGWKDGGLTGARTGWSAWLEKHEQPSSASVSAPILFVTPVGLPRAALIEWQVAFHTGESRAGATEQDDVSSGDEVVSQAVLATASSPPRFATGSSAGGKVEWQTSACDGAFFGVAAFRSLDVLSASKLLSAMPSLLTAYSLKVFHHPHISVSELQKALESLPALAAVTYVAVERIATRTQDDWAIGLVWQGIA